MNRQAGRVLCGIFQVRIAEAIEAVPPVEMILGQCWSVFLTESVARPGNQEVAFDGRDGSVCPARASFLLLHWRDAFDLAQIVVPGQLSTLGSVFSHNVLCAKRWGQEKREQQGTFLLAPSLGAQDVVRKDA